MKNKITKDIITQRKAQAEAANNTWEIKSKPLIRSYFNPIKDLQTESFYIDYLNKDKRFIIDRVYFYGTNAYDDAIKWGKANMERFSCDMIQANNI